MDWLNAGWQKKSHTHRRITGEVCGQGLSVELCRLFEDELIEGHRNGCYTLRYMLISAENSQILSRCFFRRLPIWNSGEVQLKYESINKRFSNCINIL